MFIYMFNYIYMIFSKYQKHFNKEKQNRNCVKKLKLKLALFFF